jgi:hypothetical protein
VKAAYLLDSPKLTRLPLDRCRAAVWYSQDIHTEAKDKAMANNGKKVEAVAYKAPVLKFERRCPTLPHLAADSLISLGFSSVVAVDYRNLP